MQDHDTAFAYLIFHNDLPILRLEEIIQRKQRWQNNLKKHFQFRTRAFIRCSTTRQLAGITGYAQAFCILYRKTPDELKTIPLPEGCPCLWSGFTKPCKLLHIIFQQEGNVSGEKFISIQMNFVVK